VCIVKQTMSLLIDRQLEANLRGTRNKDGKTNSNTALQEHGSIESGCMLRNGSNPAGMLKAQDHADHC